MFQKFSVKTILTLDQSILVDNPISFRRFLWQSPLDPKQVVSFEELLMSQVVQQEALTRLLVEKGIFTKEEFLEMVKAVDRKIKRKQKGDEIV